MLLSKPSRKRKIVDEGRKFQERWELSYFCTEVEGKIVCVICNASISVVKRDYDTTHKETFSCFEGKLREEKLKEMKNKLQRQQSVFIKMNKSSESAVKASYVISCLLAKHIKSAPRK